MKILDASEKLVEHLRQLKITFSKKSNYTSPDDYKLFKKNYDEFENLSSQVSFADQIYHKKDRQMKLADIIEYMFFSRGIYSLFEGNQFKEDRVENFLKLILRFVNLLMIFEITTSDNKLRKSMLKNLQKTIGDEEEFETLYAWEEKVGMPTASAGAPNNYFDSILPKTAGGLWHEMLVYAFILKYNIGYIFPLLLTQKPISLKHKLSPPDLVILHHKTYRYYGIEIGSLKERQSGGFMVPSGIPIISIDTLNARISDRCPTCHKWIGICDKVIKNFSDVKNQKIEDEIRCLVDCEEFSLEDKLDGKCRYMKFKYDGKINDIEFGFADNKHHHYHCCLVQGVDIKYAIMKNETKYKKLVVLNDILYKDKNKIERTNEEQKWFSDNYESLKRSFNYLKTHSVYYAELKKLTEMNKE